jgi:hypothetical protein
MANEPLYITLASSLAIKLASELLGATTRRVREKFSGDSRQKALEAALQEGLENSLAVFHLADLNQDHFSSLFENFLFQPEVIDELTRFIDPHPNTSLDVELLRELFNQSDFDETTLQFFSFDTFIVKFGEAFYSAAAKQSELQGGIEIGLLRSTVDQLTNVTRYTQRTAIATEKTAIAVDEISSTLEKFLQGQGKITDLTEVIEQAIIRGFEQSYELQEKLIAVLYKSGYDISVINGNVIIGESNKAENIVTLKERLELETEISRLRQVIDNQKVKEENLSIIESRYRQHIIRWFERLTFQGMMRSAQVISLPLEDVYVELRAVGEVPEAADTFSVEERRLLLEMDEKDEKNKQELMHHMDTLRRERWSRTSIERKSIVEALFKQDQRAFVILGDPGSGKSTLLHLLALVYARGPEAVQKLFKASPQESDYLPIFVPLAAFDDMLGTQPGMTLLEFLPKYFDRRRMITGLDSLFTQAMEKGGALVLFDGLDEVIDPTTRSYVANQVTALINEYSPRGVRFVMTSRFVGYRDAPIGGNIPHLSVLDFGKEEIKTFIHQWVHTYETFIGGGKETPETISLAHQLEKDLLEDVESIASVRRLAANPLMLTMLALLRRQVGRLPHRRIDLYKRYTDTLIENWMEARSHGEREHHIRMVDPHHAESILIPLAFWLQSTQASGTASKAAIHSALTDIFLQESGIEPSTAPRAQRKLAEEHAQEFLTDMRNMSGLIVERGYDAFGFLHLTFQEYFAGRALAQMEPEARWDAIVPHLHDPRWREPILLCAGQLGTVEKRKLQVSKFVEEILTCEDPTEGDLHRNLLLALSIACDDVNLEYTLLCTLVEKSLACLPTNVYILAREIIKNLSQLIANGVAGAECCLSCLSDFEDPLLRSTMIDALSEFVEHPGIRQTILQSLDDQDENVRKAAVNALTLFVSDTGVCQEILKHFGDQHWTVQIAAIDILAKLAPSDEKIRQEILQRFTDHDFDVRCSAINALAALNLSDKEVRQATLQCLNDDYSGVRSAAINALAGMALLDATVHQAIKQCINDYSWQPKDTATENLKQLLSSDTEIREAVIQRIYAPNVDVRSSTVNLLGSLISTNSDVLQAIFSRLNDQNEMVRNSAINALAALAPSNQDVRKAIFKLFDDQNAGVRKSVIRALAGLIYSEQEIFQAIITSLSERNWEIRFQAIEALASMLKDQDNISLTVSLFFEAERNLATAEPEIIVSSELSLFEDIVAIDSIVQQKFLKRLQDEDADVRSSAVKALANLIPSDPGLRQSVLQLLNDQEWTVRRSVLRSIKQFVTINIDIRQAVLKCLSDENEDVRMYAIETLAGLVSSDVNIHQAIMKCLDDHDVYVRNSAIIALKPTVAFDKNTQQAILQCVNNQDKTIQSSAVLALEPLVLTDLSVREIILQQLNNGEWQVQRSVFSVLRPLISSDEHIRLSVLRKLEDQNEYVRISAISALAKVISLDPDICQAISRRLDDNSGDVIAFATCALKPFLASDTSLRQAIIKNLNHQNEFARMSAVGALAEFVVADEDIRQAVLQRIDDKHHIVRISAINVLAKLVVSDADIRQAMLQPLRDKNEDVRKAAFLALCETDKLNVFDKNTRQELVNWLGVSFDNIFDLDLEGIFDSWLSSEYDNNSERRYSQALQNFYSLFGKELPKNQTLVIKMLDWLKSPRWQDRLGAIRTLSQWPGGIPNEIRDKILDALDDIRGLESFPARLAASSYLINRDPYSKDAIQVGLDALEYGTLPWEYINKSGDVRKQAALMLGTLEPTRYDPIIYERLLQAMKTDQDEKVRNALYTVLVKLAGSKQFLT